jgi:dihydrofolate synthase / folylpolyglutamate synthase
LITGFSLVVTENSNSLIFQNFFPFTFAEMNYQQTIDFLFTRLPMFSHIGAAAYKKDLTNISILCEALGNPHKKFKSVHVAGTNGKGSVSHMLAAILQTAGYKTGLHTSPHLHDFRERIKVNGAMAGEKFVIDFVDKIQPVIEEITPSFFEISVAMAFDYFALQQVDIAVIEVGLGGRLDSTNIILPEVSVITNIGMDHMQLLGNTKKAIAFEKAGIIKPAIPVVIGEYNEQTAGVFTAIAAEKNAPIFFADKNYSATDWRWEKQQLIVEVEKQHQQDRHLYHLDLPGIYQVKNLLTVLETTDALHRSGWKIELPVIQKALSQVKKLTDLHGRWEIIHHAPMIVLDVAHNEDGIKQVMKQVELTSHTQLHIILGMVKDKEIESILSLLPSSAYYYFTQANIPRALDAASLQEKASMAGLHGGIYKDVKTAINEATNKASADDLILVCGSNFLVGEV